MVNLYENILVYKNKSLILCEKKDLISLKFFSFITIFLFNLPTKKISVLNFTSRKSRKCSRTQTNIIIFKVEQNFKNFKILQFYKFLKVSRIQSKIYFVKKHFQFIIHFRFFEHGRRNQPRNSE